LGIAIAASQMQAAKSDFQDKFCDLSDFDSARRTLLLS